MKKADVVVIGGSAAGIPAAVTCRRYYPEKSALLIRREKQVLVPCGIPYIFGTLGSPDKNLIPDTALEKNNIELMIDEVTEIDRENRLLNTASGEKVGYEKLILATGSSPSIPPISGVDKENIFVAKKDIPYLEKLLNKLEDTSDLVIVGGGFIGMEFADECKKNRDINITIVEMLSHCLLLACDEDICIVAEDLIRKRGIEVLTSERVEAFLGNEKVEKVKLASGKEIKADAVIMATGTVANTELAKKAGLEIGPTRSIQVDRTMRTSDENIFACGDCAEKVSFFTGKPIALRLASIAVSEARIAGANAFDIQRENMGAVGVFSTAIGGTAFTTAGLTEKIAKDNGYDIVIGEAEAANRHPGGMPGMAKLKIKLIFNKRNGVILGGQVSGANSAGELINAISACIQQKMTADDVAMFQMGTHPVLTASPIVYPLTTAAELAVKAMR